jgi:UDP-glucuronate decarboxylase
MAIASAFFFLQPQFLVSRKQHGSAAATYGKMPYEIAEELGSSISSYDRMAIVRKHQPSVISPGAKLPLGLQRKPLRVVVTGGAGFVGSHLVDKLMARGDSVIVVDNFFTGRKENVMHHFGNPRFELIRHDVVEPLLLEVDQIYHLACPASPVHYKFNPVKTIISLSCPCSHSSLICFIIIIFVPLFSFKIIITLSSNHPHCSEVQIHIHCMIAGKCSPHFLRL